MKWRTGSETQAEHPLYFDTSLVARPPPSSRNTQRGTFKKGSASAVSEITLPSHAARRSSMDGPVPLPLVARPMAEGPTRPRVWLAGRAATSASAPGKAEGLAGFTRRGRGD
jgi:hypothetical protein